MRLLSCLLLALMLAGCSSRLSAPPAGVELLPAEPTLWKLSLEKGGKPLYAGLLLLNRQDGVGSLLLLDSTGIKLMEAKVTGEGEVFGIKALGPVADRGLPGFLARSVYRLFLSGPSPGKTCRPQEYGELCLGLDENGRLVKIRRWGPFVLWEGGYSINNEGQIGQASRAVLSGGWFSPEVILQRQIEPGKPSE